MLDLLYLEAKSWNDDYPGDDSKSDTAFSLSGPFLPHNAYTLYDQFQ